MLCVDRIVKKECLQRGETRILEGDNGQSVLLENTMALYLLYGAWRIFVLIHSLIYLCRNMSRIWAFIQLFLSLL